MRNPAAKQRREQETGDEDEDEGEDDGRHEDEKDGRAEMTRTGEARREAQGGRQERGRGGEGRGASCHQNMSLRLRELVPAVGVCGCKSLPLEIAEEGDQVRGDGAGT
jgi:hypothetical protein